VARGLLRRASGLLGLRSICALTQRVFGSVQSGFNEIAFRCAGGPDRRAISQKPPDSLSRPQDVGGGDGLAAGQSYSEDLRARVLAAVDGGFVLRPQTDITRRDEAVPPQCHSTRSRSRLAT